MILTLYTIGSDELKYNNIKNNNLLQKICREDFEISYNTNESVEEIIIRGIEESRMSAYEFEKRSGVSGTSITRYRNKVSNPCLEVIVAYCITMKINVFESLYLISKAGYNVFCSDDKRVYLLLIILSRYYGINVKTANDILIDLDMKPLNNLHTISDGGEKNGK